MNIDTEYQVIADKSGSFCGKQCID